MLEQAYPALERLRSEGLVGAIGAGMNQSEMLARFARLPAPLPHWRSRLRIPRCRVSASALIRPSSSSAMPA